MAKKIDGYCQSHDNQDYLDRGNTVYVNRTPCTGKDPRCTVVVHKGKSERVFTESEVRAMVNELKEEAEDDHVRAWIDGVVTRHGLDPA